MTTTTITWTPVADGLPDAESNVLLGIDVDGIKTSCEGFLSDDMHGNPCWYDVTAQPLPHEQVVAWADLPECPL